MKKRMFSVLTAFAVLALVVGVVVAQTGIPGTGWWTGEQVQNVGTATANVVVTAYDKNGALTYTASQTATVGSTSVSRRPTSPVCRLVSLVRLW